MVQYSMDNDWLDRFFEDDPVLNDKMMSEALQPPQVRSDHSYSREDGAESPLNLCKADNKGKYRHTDRYRHTVTGKIPVGTWVWKPTSFLRNSAINWFKSGIKKN